MRLKKQTESPFLLKNLKHASNHHLGQIASKGKIQREIVEFILNNDDISKTYQNLGYN